MGLDYLKLIFKDMKQRKFSTFLTFFAISLGILSIFVIVLVGEGFENSIAKQFEVLGTNRLYVATTSQSLADTNLVRGFTDNDVRLLENRPFVKEVYPYYARRTLVEFSNDFRNTQIYGVKLGENYFKDFNLEIKEGRFPRENERYAMVIGSRAASERFDREIRVNSNIIIRDTRFKVVGILESAGNPEDDNSMFVNYITLRDLFGDRNVVGLMDVVIVDGYDIEIARENIKRLLENRLGKDTVEVIAPTQLLEQVTGILNIVKYVLGGIGAVSLIIGAVGIINTMFVIITEKTREIGIMKSIGATNSKILIMYVFQSGLFGFLGGIFGIIMGSFAAKLFENIAKNSGFDFLEITIIPEYTIGLLIFSFLIGVISGLIPSIKASKINIIEAIRK